MGGRIEVESRVGEGSQFTFIVPLGKPTMSQAELDLRAADLDADGSSDRQVQPLRILLAEDNPTNQIVTQKILEAMGHGVDIVADGGEAVDAVQRFPYDLILMDVQMPEMDGLEVTRRIRALGGRHASIPIVALTANVVEGTVKKCREAGMNDYLSKPFRVHALHATVPRWGHVTSVEGRGQGHNSANGQPASNAAS